MRGATGAQDPTDLTKCVGRVEPVIGLGGRDEVEAAARQRCVLGGCQDCLDLQPCCNRAFAKDGEH